MRDEMVGEIIKRLRSAAGMSVKELAASSQVSPTCIRKIESGQRRDMSVSTAKKLAAGLGVSPAVFFGAKFPRDASDLSSRVNNHAEDQLAQWAANVQAGIDTLLEECHRLRILCDAGSEGVIVMERGVVLFVNQQFLDMQGIACEPCDFIGTDGFDMGTFLNIVTPRSLADAYQRLVNQDTSPFTIDIMRPDGSGATLWVRAKVIDYRGRQVGVGVLRYAPWDDPFNLAFKDLIDWKDVWAELQARDFLREEPREADPRTM